MPRGKSAKNLELIDRAYEFLATNHPTTVRGVAYALFVAGVIPSMETKHTKRVSEQLTYAREEDMIPWEWIVDETRRPERAAQWDNPDQYVRTMQIAYRRDRWLEQDEYIEVWAEKGTIRGVLAQVLNRYGVGFRVMHGFGGATTIHEAAEEFAEDWREVTILYLGDWDPSGLWMSEVDLPERLERYGWLGNIDRVALDEQDIQDGGLPWFPLEDKTKDSRAAWFLQRYGSRCWELDAMPANDLRARVEEAIRDHIDFEAWDRAEMVEKAEQASLREVLGNWKSAR